MSAPYDEVDPGVRQLVRLLAEEGFCTCDSGDGRSKFQEDGSPLSEWDGVALIAVPHVAMTCEPTRLIDESYRLHRLMVSLGVGVQAQGMGDAPSIQASFDPCDAMGLIVLLGVDDALLANTKAGHLLQG